MSWVNNLLAFFPEVKKPEQKVGFKEKLKWTLIILVAFYILSVIPLFGLGHNELARFEQLSIILGASFGSILSLGIGPIVTASIVLQLLTGSKILNIDLTSHDGRAYFQSLQKLASVFFILFEAAVYVFLGGLTPDPALRGSSAYFSMQLILVIQLIIGGLLIMFMDEVVSKWGFGSGLSLFIAAGVASEIVIRAFSPLNSVGEWAFGSGQQPVGAFLVFIISLVGGAPKDAFLALFSILATLVVFVMSVYAQAIKVEIPLSFGRVSGFGIRWPLNFLYTSNIPVILVAALLANIQLVGNMVAHQTDLGRCGPLGCFGENGTPSSGIVYFMTVPSSLSIQVFFLLFMAIVFSLALGLYYLKLKNKDEIKIIARIKFYLKLAQFGYLLQLKPVKIFHEPDGGISKKANCDVDMTFDLMKYIKDYSDVLILSGDGDFAIVLKYLMHINKKVTVLARGERTARDIRQLVGGDFRDFTRLRRELEFIKK